MKDSFTLTGHVKIIVRTNDGSIREEQEHSNVVVTVGKTFLASWLIANSQSGPFMPYVGLGTGTSPASASDTALETEFSGGGYFRPVGGLTSSSNSWTNTATFGAGNATGNISEAGLFSAVTSGTMFSHLVFSPISKTSGESITVIWTITIN